MVRGAASLPRGQLLGTRYSPLKSSRPKQFGNIETPSEVCLRSGMLNRDVQGGALPSSVSPMVELKRMLSDGRRKSSLGSMGGRPVPTTVLRQQSS
jgi:hypothetical protein